MKMRNLMCTRMLLAAALLICGANALAQGPPAGGRGQLGIAPLKDFLDLSDEQVLKLQENQNALREAVRSAVEETTRKHREQALVVLNEEQKERLESMQSALRQRQAGRAALGAAALNLIEPGDIRSGFGGARSRSGFRRGGRAGGPGGRSGSAAGASADAGALAAPLGANVLDSAVAGRVLVLDSKAGDRTAPTEASPAAGSQAIRRNNGSAGKTRGSFASAMHLFGTSRRRLGQRLQPESRITQHSASSVVLITKPGLSQLQSCAGWHFPRYSSALTA